MNKKAVDEYNKAFTGSGHLGPRKLGAKQSGTIMAPGDRKFISQYLLADEATLDIKKLDGKADVELTICTYDGQTHAKVGADTLEGKEKSAGYHRSFSGLRGKTVGVLLNGKGLLKSMKYDLTFSTRN